MYILTNKYGNNTGRNAGIVERNYQQRMGATRPCTPPADTPSG